MIVDRVATQLTQKCIIIEDYGGFECVYVERWLWDNFFFSFKNWQKNRNDDDGKSESKVRFFNRPRALVEVVKWSCLVVMWLECTKI